MVENSVTANQGKKPHRQIFYGWWMVAAGFWGMVAYGGAIYSFGILFKPMAADFGWTRAAVSGAMTLHWLIHGICYIFAGALVDKYGPRRVITPAVVFLFLVYLLLSRLDSLWQLYLFYGILAGLGKGFCGYVPMASVVSRWFVRRRGLALGIMVAGSGVGIVFIPPLVSYVIVHMGWRTAFIVLGLILLVVLGSMAMILKRDPGEKGLLPHGYAATGAASSEPGFSFRQALLTPRLWLLLTILFANGVADQMVMVHIVNYATDVGITPIVAATILSLIGLGSIVGRVVMGAFSDRFGSRLSMLACLIVLGLALLWLTYLRTIPLFYTFALIFGMAYGGSSALIAIITAEVFGLRSVGSILGAVTLGGTLGSGVGPVVAGYIFDVTLSYNNAFLLGALMAGAAALLAVFLPKRRASI